MSQVQNYLEGQVKERLKRANIFENRVNEDRQASITLQRELQEYKKANPGKGFGEMKDKLIETQKLHYYSALIEMQLKQEVGLIKEHTTMADMLKLDLNLDDEQKEIVRFIQTMNSNFFVTDEKGEIIIPDATNKKLLEEGLQKSLTDEKRLKEIWEMIPVS